MTLPARVRISRLPLPPAHGVALQLTRLCPEVPLADLQAAAVALAGGRVVGALLRHAGQLTLGVDPGWRGKGLEAALQHHLEQEA
ncbi:hypothetical protein [Deinococcus sonorensis]|uniref:N-acetyltransferase domain-containing protein n=2 Tax=Deinococcus sonorensis TaxID=309891 RepID=A0AAU7UDB2_9DEIO